MTRYETVIGLEVHVQLRTYSKLFCSCTHHFGKPANTQVCQIDLGMPGVLPPLNSQAFQCALMMGLAFHCEIASYTKFDRKNYFYPDLPKGYQISQYDKPFCSNGYLDIETGGAVKRVGITRIHLEEDAGKLLHPEQGEAYSRVDFNRAGIPLCEMVSEPDLRSPQEAYDYLTLLKQTVKYLGVSDCDMEKGSLRVDANCSVRPLGQQHFNTKVEIKNLNSFKAVKEALEYEVQRQTALYEAKRGGEVRQETRLWDEKKHETRVMRSKEAAHDYRYFPEPDIPPVYVDSKWIDEVRESLPEGPLSRKQRLMKDYQLSDYDAGELTALKEIADYFENAVDAYDNPKQIANWLMGSVMQAMNARGVGVKQLGVPPKALAELVKIAADREVTNTVAKEVFDEMIGSGKSPREIIQNRSLSMVSDMSQLEAVGREIIAANPTVVEQYKGGKTSTIGFFVGQAMKKMGGKADPNALRKVFESLLS